jgi:hypothetical protein
MLRWRIELIRTKAGARHIMVGRPRKTGRRQPNGQLARVYVNPRDQVAMQPHRILVPVKLRETPEAESEFGRLLCLSHITRAQYEAGKMYVELVEQWRCVKGFPPMTAQAIDLSSVRGGQGREVPRHVVQAVERRYAAAFESICGQLAQKAVADYAVREQKIDLFDGLKYLKLGLSDLVKHFAIDPSLQISKSRT